MDHTTVATPGPTLPPPPHAPPPPDRQAPPPASGRASALWVTATGAVLLLAAAALFVAVRWDQIPDVAKLGVLAVVTAACLAVGRRTTSRLPVTGRVLHHLGAALVPLDVAAVAVHLAAGSDLSPTWPAVGLVTGATAMAAWWALGRLESAPALVAGAVAAAVPTAVCLDATTGLPAAVVLVAGASAASLLPANRARTGAALTWSLAAGFAPLLLAVAEVLGLERLAAGTRLALDQPLAVTMAAGLGAAVVLVSLAKRLRRTELALAALGSAGLVALEVRTDLTMHGGALDAIGVTTLFLGAELVALRARGDELWARWTAALAGVAEVAAGTATALVALVLPISFSLSTDAGPVEPLGDSWWLAGVLAASSWMVADRRRQPDQPVRAWLRDGRALRPTLPMLASTAFVAPLAATAAPETMAVVLVATASAIAALTRSRPLRATSVSACALAGAALAGSSNIAATVGLGLVATAAIGIALVTLVRPRSGAEPSEAAWYEATVLSLALVVLTPGLLAAIRLADRLDTTVLVAGLIAVWGGASFLADRHPLPGTTRGAGVLGRALGVGVVFLAVVAVAEATTPTSAASAAAVLLSASAASALVLALATVRRDDPIESTLLAVPVPGVLAGVLLTAGSPASEVGMALGVLALAAAGTHLLLGDRWWPPTLAIAVLAASAGLALTSADQAATGVVLSTVAVALLIEAVVARSPLLGAAAGTLGTIGTWFLLDAAGITAADAWAAPVALSLGAYLVVVLGDRVSSWVTLGVPIALVAGTALAERLAGGTAVHGLAAGAVGVAAVALGGWRRMAAPLVLGTATLAGLTVHETLSFTAGVPTWAWLAAGGSALVATGIALERNDTTPVAASTHLVNELRTRLR